MYNSQRVWVCCLVWVQVNMGLEGDDGGYNRTGNVSVEEGSEVREEDRAAQGLGTDIAAPAAWAAVHQGGYEEYQGEARVNWYELKEHVRRGQVVYQKVHDMSGLISSGLKKERETYRKQGEDVQRMRTSLTSSHAELQAIPSLLSGYYAARPVPVAAPVLPVSLVASRAPDLGSVSAPVQVPASLAEAQSLLQQLLRESQQVADLLMAFGSGEKVLAMIEQEVASLDEKAWKLYLDLDAAIAQKQARSSLEALEAMAEYGEQMVAYLKGAVAEHRMQLDRLSQEVMQRFRQSVATAKSRAVPLTQKEAATRPESTGKKAADKLPEPVWYWRWWNSVKDVALVGWQYIRSLFSRQQSVKAVPMRLPK